MYKRLVFLIGVFFLVVLSVVRAEIVFNEIFFDPEGSDSGREWIEIFNNGSENVNISKWKFFEEGANHGLTLTQGSDTLAGGDYVIIADNAGIFLWDYSGFIGNLFDSSFSLSNTGELLAVKNESLDVVEQLNYSDYDLQSISEGRSLEKIDSNGGNDNPNNWQVGAFNGTPGGFNNQAPTVSFLLINSTAPEQFNYTNETLNMNFLCDDLDGDAMTSHVIIYRDGVPQFGFDNNCSNNEYLALSIDSANTTKNENWNFQVNVSDGTSFSSDIYSNNITINNAPPTFYPISDFSLDEDFGSYTLNLTLNVTDIDEGEFTYNWMVVFGNWFNVAINNDTGILTLNSIANLSEGFDTLGIWVLDSDSASGSTVPGITINAVNDQPWQASPEGFTNASWDEDIGTFTVVSSADINASFSDVENNNLPTVALLSESDTSAADCYISAGALLCNTIANRSGSSTVVLNLSDKGGLSIEMSTLVTINEVNDAPGWIYIPQQSSNEDAPSEFNLSSYAFDVEDPPSSLVYNLINNNTGLATILLDSSTGNLSWFTVANQSGDANISVTVYDTSGLSEQTEFNLHINEVNDKPVFDPISDFSLDEDFGAYTIDLSSNISDVETSDTDLTIDFTNSNSSLLTISVDNTTNVITFNSAGNQSGIAAITLTVWDAGGLQDSISFIITVNPVNDAPLARGMISDIVFDEDGSDSSIDLDDYFFDVDSEVTFIVSLITDNNVSVKIDALTNVVNISAADNWFGSSNVVFGAYDVVSNIVLQNPILVSVNSVNDVPIWQKFDTIIVEEDSGLNATFNLSEFVKDEDDVSKDFVFTVVKKVENEVDVSISDNGENLEFIPANNFSGISNSVIEVSDGIDSANLTILFNITAVNDVPRFNSTPVLEIDEDRPYSYQVTAEDADNDVLTYSLSGANWLGIDSNSGLVVGFPTNDDVAKHNIAITVSDGILTEVQNFVINVTNVNDAPILREIGQQDLRVDAAYSLTVNASDVDLGDVLTFSANDTLFSIDANSGAISFTPNSSQDGLYWINISVNDSANAIDSEAVLFNITLMNKEPVNLTIPDLSWDEDSNKSLNLSDFFIDPDGDVLVFNFTTTNNITILLDRDTVTLVPDKNFFGSNVTRFNASDGVNTTESNEVTLTVLNVNDEPFLLTNLTNKEWNEDNSLMNAFNLNDYFKDIDNAILSYSVSGNDRITVIIYENGSVDFIPREDFSGAEYVVFSASDGINVSNSNNISLTVRNFNEIPSIIGTISLNMDEDSGASFDLTQYENDTEDSGMDLTWGVVSLNKSLLEAVITNINEDILTITPVKDQNGIGIITLMLRDSNGAIAEANVSVTIRPINDKPEILIFEPSINNPKVHRNREQRFSIGRRDIDGDALTVQWYVNGNAVEENRDEFTFIPSDNGLFNISVVVSDNKESIIKEWSLLAAEKPIANNFGGNSTNFANLNENELQGVNDVVLEDTSRGSILFKESLNLSEVVDIDNNVRIENGVVAINSINLPELNKAARITLKGLRYNTVPKIFFNNGFTINAEDINEECRDCSLIGFTDPPTSNGEVIFDVARFSSYRIGESGESLPLSFTNLDSCENGSIGSLKVNINEPDRNDDFKPGDTINVEADAENKGEDRDVKVTTILYNVDNQDEEEKETSDEQSINKNEEEIFEVSLETDNDLDERDSYILFVKAFEDGNEESECTEKFIPIDIEREDNDVRINEISNPEIASCRDVVEFKIEVENFGSEDEEVYIELRNEDLNLNQVSERFTLDNEESVIKRLSFAIPEDSKEGTYNTEINAVSEGKTDSRSVILEVDKCEDIRFKPLDVKIVTKSTSPEDNKAGIHLVIDNKESKDVEALLEVKALGSWGDADKQELSLHPGENNVYASLNLKEGIEGTRSGRVVIMPKEKEFDVVEDNFNVDIVKASKVEKEEGLAINLFDAGRVLLVVLVILVLIFLVRLNKLTKK